MAPLETDNAIASSLRAIVADPVKLPRASIETRKDAGEIPLLVGTFRRPELYVPPHGVGNEIRDLNRR